MNHDLKKLFEVTISKTIFYFFSNFLQQFYRFYSWIFSKLTWLKLILIYFFPTLVFTFRVSPTRMGKLELLEILNETEAEWDAMSFGEQSLDEPDLCFFLRTLISYDPFDANYWNVMELPTRIFKGFVNSAPEFVRSHEVPVLTISRHFVDLSSNIDFFFSLDNSTKLFLLIKCFARCGVYLPELMLFATLIFLFCVSARTVRMFAVIRRILIISVVLLFFQLFLPFAPIELFTGYKMDGYGKIIKFIFLLFATFYFLLFSSWEKESNIKKEVYITTIFFLLFSLILISNSNLWIFFFSLEGISFCVIITFVFNCSGRGNIADAIRYFCLNSVASGMLLLSISLIEYITSTVDYNELSNHFLLDKNFCFVPNSLLVAFLLFLISSSFKLGLFPFNIYEVDTYKKSSYMVIYFAALIAKIPFFFVWLKLVWRVVPFMKVILPTLFLFALLTSVIGTVGALFQKSIRAFFTYSSMSHIGLMIASFSTQSALGVDAVFLYFISYILAMSIIYLILIKLEAAGIDLHAIHQLRELRADTVLSVTFSLAILSLAGFPPTIGFFSKLALIANLIEIGQVWVVLLIFVLSLVSLNYYFRIMRIIWIEVNDEFILKYTNEDLLKIKRLSSERIFVLPSILSFLLLFFSFTFIYTVKTIIALTASLWCVANYLVDWWLFLRILVNFKIYILSASTHDWRVLQEIRELQHKTDLFKGGTVEERRAVLKKLWLSRWRKIPLDKVSETSLNQK